MIKHFCDKCGTEVPDDLLKNVEVHVNNKLEKKLELCGACRLHLNWFLNEPSYAGIRKQIIDGR